MKVKILKSGLYGDRNFAAGEVVDLDAGLAARILEDGDGEAEERAAPPPPPPAPKPSQKLTDQAR